MSGVQSWMLYGAAGYTGALVAQHARRRGHQPVLAGRDAAAVAALAERLDLPHRAATPRHGCKPASPTPSPLPPASAP